MEKEIANQVQEARRVPYWINPRRNIPRHILIKLIKTTHKEILNLLDSTGNSAQYYVITLWSPGGRMGEGIVRKFERMAFG